jgi:Tfp pilus assembly protein PilW
MRIVLIGLVIVFILLLGAGAGFFVYKSKYSDRMNASSKAFVDEAVPAIASTWSKGELVKRSSPQLQEKISGGTIDDLFAKLAAHLGSYQSYDGATGDVSTHFSIHRMTMTAMAIYDCHVSFQNGKLKIKLILRANGDNWEIVGFDIHPDDSSSSGT